VASGMEKGMAEGYDRLDELVGRPATTSATSSDVPARG